MRRVLVAGDSLSMARYVDGLLYEQIYPVRVQLACPHDIVINGSMRGNCSRAIASEPYLSEFLLPLRPHHVVLQVGIVDCTPRLFSSREKLILAAMQRIPGLRSASRAVISTASRHRYALTRRRPLCEVSPADFGRYLRAFAGAARESNPECALTIVNVPHPGEAHVRANYRVASNIEQYNAILQELATELHAGLVDLHAYTARNPSSLLPDGYHLSAAAHEFIHQELVWRLHTRNGNQHLPQP